MIEALANLDKSTWVKHRFDEIAMMVSERVDPNKTDLEIYVGLEHLDSESLHIRSHGSADDVNGTKLRFYRGDVIFGRRRAYQRKAAIAEYDGFCSAHALVLRAKPEVIEPALFPFFLHSDQFMHRAVDISVGSLSPTINWKSLRKQEFLLPPKAEQARLAELLWAGDRVLEGLEKVNKDLKQLSLAVFKEQSLVCKDLKEYRLSDLIADVTAGRSLKCGSEDYVEGNPGILKTSAITSKVFKPGEAKPIDSDVELPVSVRANCILINRKNTPSLVGTGVYNEVSIPYLYLPDLIWQITVNENLVHPYYLYLHIMSSKFQNKIDSIRSGTSLSMVNISQKNFLKLKAAIPSFKSQVKIMENVKKSKYSFDKSVGEIKSTHDLQKSLINQIF